MASSDPLKQSIHIEKKSLRTSSKPERDSPAPAEKKVYIEIEDEITDVVDRLRRLPHSRIALFVPKRAFLLSSAINLKILAKKMKELGKEITIVTQDAAGQKNAAKAGLKAVEKLIKTAIQFDAARPLIRGERPVRVPAQKVSISQVVHSHSAPLLAGIIEKVRERIRSKKKGSAETRIVFSAPNKQALFTLILVSILLVVAIAYIALPGATIYITPRSTVLDPSFNVSFLDFEKNRASFRGDVTSGLQVASFPVDPPPFTKRIRQNATGKISRGQRARGTLTVINESNQPWELAATTRFQTDDGLIFRTPRAVRVPPAKPTGFGRLDVEVIADEIDVRNQVIGTRGNIGPTQFFLPGLQHSANRKKLYAQSSAPFAGGTTEVVNFVTNADVEAAQKNLKTLIAKDALDELKTYLEQENLVKKTSLSLLPDRNLISIGEPVITVPPDLVNAQIGDFALTASYAVRGIAYDRRELISAMRERIATRADPDKKVVRVSEDDLTYKFLDRDERAGKVRLTVTMRALQAFELDPETENGKRFLKKITDHIVGMRISQAKEFLQQQTEEIAGVEIKTWPVWAPTIPTIADNIKFVVKEEQ